MNSSCCFHSVLNFKKHHRDPKYNWPLNLLTTKNSYFAGRYWQSCALGGPSANEVQCCQMSLYESYSALFTQTNYSQLHTASANLGKRSVRKISWHITITENMDWGQHIYDISSTVAKTLCFLRRNLTFAPRNTKEGAYKTLVRSKLEYAAPFWSPYCKTQIQQLEKVIRTWRRWRDTSSVGEYE